MLPRSGSRDEGLSFWMGASFAGRPVPATTLGAALFSRDQAAIDRIPGSAILSKNPIKKKI
jgi:hypothetical protein